ncbi:hypothetical protein TNCV_1654391 [Trichonephila clavipes]|nr:hypothetical protein TNCV_1654391 [Trichonephila clavipes]
MVECLITTNCTTGKSWLSEDDDTHPVVNVINYAESFAKTVCEHLRELIFLTVDSSSDVEIDSCRRPDRCSIPESTQTVSVETRKNVQAIFLLAFIKLAEECQVLLESRFAFLSELNSGKGEKPLLEIIFKDSIFFDRIGTMLEEMSETGRITQELIKSLRISIRKDCSNIPELLSRVPVFENAVIENLFLQSIIRLSLTCRELLRNPDLFRQLPDDAKKHVLIHKGIRRNVEVELANQLNASRKDQDVRNKVALDTVPIENQHHFIDVVGNGEEISSNHTKLSKNSGNLPKELSLEGASSEMYLEDTAEMKQNVENIQGKQRKFASRDRVISKGMVFFLIFWISIFAYVDCWIKSKHLCLISKEATWPEECSTIALFHLSNSECLCERKNSNSCLYFDYDDKRKKFHVLKSTKVFRKTVKNAEEPLEQKSEKQSNSDKLNCCETPK